MTNDDVRRDARAALGEVVWSFYERLLVDTTSPRVRDSVQQVLAEAAAEHRAGARRSKGSRRMTAVSARKLARGQ